jgi:hypothetical protein
MFLLELFPHIIETCRLRQHSVIKLVKLQHQYFKNISYVCRIVFKIHAKYHKFKGY